MSQMIAPRRYKKKPVVIEAIQFSGSTSQVKAIETWMNGGEYRPPGLSTRDMRSIEIETSEGTMEARPGDWIIKGVHGEFYPCKPEIFEATYEEVSEAGEQD